MQSEHLSRGIIGGVTVFGVLQITESVWPSIASVWIAPSAWLAAALINIPLLPGPEPILDHPVYPVQVVASCGGWDFFSLLAALLTGHTIRLKPFRMIRAFFILPVAAAVTVLANAARLVSVLLGGLYVLPLLPSPSMHAFHTALGVAIFLPSLILAFIAWERSIRHHGANN